MDFFSAYIIFSKLVLMFMTTVRIILFKIELDFKLTHQIERLRIFTLFNELSQILFLRVEKCLNADYT
jgi:hypothetical protein